MPPRYLSVSVPDAVYQDAVKENAVSMNRDVVTLFFFHARRCQLCRIENAGVMLKDRCFGYRKEGLFVLEDVRFGKSKSYVCERLLRRTLR